MKKYISLLILLIPFIVFSCKSGDSGTDTTENTDNTYTQLKTVTITSAGGTIETNDFTLTIPPNAVSGSANITLSSSQTMLDAPSAVTNLFKFECTSSIKLSYIKIKYTGTLSGQNYVVWQEDSYIKSAGKVANAKFYIPARDSSGYLVAKLSDVSSAMGKISSPMAANPTGLFYALTGQGVLNSGTHFKVYYPTANASQATDLTAYLETAYTLLQSYGFNFIGRDWPADIYLQKFDGWLNGKLGLDNNAYGYYMTTTYNPLYVAYRTNNVAMYFNLNLMTNPGEMRATAGHEFFHAVQDLYDPRDPVAKKWSASPHAWLDEACAVWFEDKMNTPPLFPVSLSGNELEFTKGIHVSGTGVQDHGYGMAPMIKYIASQKGTSAIASIYTKINTGSHPVDAIFSTMNTSGNVYNTDWYNNFLKAYIPGSIYSVVPFAPSSAETRRYNSKTLADTLNTFAPISFPDFSGKFYYVTLEVSDIATRSVSVNFKTTLSTSRVHLFQYTGSADLLLKSGSTNGEITLNPSEVKGSLSAGNGKLYILALVTNNDYHSGFQGSTDIGMTVKINYNAGPSIALSPDAWQGRVNESKMFSLTASNLPARYRYDWSWGDGQTESSTSVNATHSYASAGAYNITVNLYDLDLNQNVATANGTAIISNNVARINPDGSEGMVNTGYQFNVITDYTLTNARYEWDFGDGSSKTIQYNTKTASHTYSATGNYNITCDIYDNARGVKIESATTTFKVSDVSPLLAAIKASTGISMENNCTFSSGSEYDGFSAYYMTVSNFNIAGVTTQTFTWTGINTFTATRTDYSGSTPSTLTINGTVSMDGQTVTLDWLDHSAGTGSYAWYLSELKVSVQNMPIVATDGSAYTARYRISNSTQFTGYYKKADVIDPHSIKTYSTPRSSTITIEFLK